MKTYRELHRDMGPYRTVRTVHVYTCFTSKRVSCMFRRDVCIVTYMYMCMSGLAVEKIHDVPRTAKHHSSGAALSLMALVTILATDS